MKTTETSIFDCALLVEDELHLATSLKIALRKMEIHTVYSSTIHEAEKLIQEHQPDLILLDRQLPDGDGLSLCKKLRQANYPGMILILTAAGGPPHRVEGLEAGADDYLPKPFSWDELAARIRALGRRKPKKTQESTWDLEPSKLKIKGPKGWVDLTVLEFKLAAKLIQNPNTIITREELLKKVWGFRFLPKTRTVDHFMGRLRKYFEKDSDNPEFFITVRGSGYKFKNKSMQKSQ